MSTGLTSHVLMYNVNKIRYPWRESLQSVLPVSDEVIVCECFSTDGTWEELDAWSRRDTRIRIIRRPWGTKCEILGDLVNECIKEVKTPVHFQIQADEVLHDDSYGELIQLAKNMPANAAMIQYLHFLSDFEHTYEFMYSKLPRIAKTSAGWVSGGDACALGGPPPVCETGIMMHHYGKVSVGRGVEASIKEFEFQNMYKHYGFPDPLIVKAYNEGRINYRKVCEQSGKKHQIEDFTGRHPTVMTAYIAEAKRREIEFQAKGS